MIHKTHAWHDCPGRKSVGHDIRSMRSPLSHGQLFSSRTLVACQPASLLYVGLRILVRVRHPMNQFTSYCTYSSQLVVPTTPNGKQLVTYQSPGRSRGSLGKRTISKLIQATRAPNVTLRDKHVFLSQRKYLQDISLDTSAD